MFIPNLIQETEFFYELQNQILKQVQDDDLSGTCHHHVIRTATSSEPPRHPNHHVILNLFQDLVQIYLVGFFSWNGFTLRSKPIRSRKIVKKNLSLYIHYPFCKSKCPYCDFNSHVRASVNHESFLRAYETELDFFAEKLRGRKVTTIFFGGGTPSLMPIFLVEGILQKISAIWEVSEDCEISLEANPTSFEAAKFKDLRKVGVNRLSLGIQALNDVDLKFLGREHSAKEAIQTIETAAKIFENFSFDLIYARPQQTLGDWSDELRRAINFGTKHLSLYQLTIEKGTKFFSEFQQKKFAMPDENLSAEFYEMTDEITAGAGFGGYEISNYASVRTPSTNNVMLSLSKHDSGCGLESCFDRLSMTLKEEIKLMSDYRCRHNLTYWQGGDYLGIGAGAHSRLYLDGEKNRSAISMLCEPNAWLKKVSESGAGIQKSEKISSDELLEELILTGLRLADGIASEIFQTHFEKNLEEIFDFKKLERLAAQGLIEVSKNRLNITKKSRLLTNSIIKKVCEVKN